ETGEHDVAALGRGRCQGDVRRVDVDHAGEGGARGLAQREHLLDVRLPSAPALEIAALAGRHRLHGRCRERPHRAGVEVGEPLEHGKLGAGLFEVHVSVLSTGAWSESSMPFRPRRWSGQTTSGPASAPRTRTWSMPGPSPVKPRWRRSGLKLKS